MVGFVAAFVSAFLCVRWLLRYISSHDFTVFAWYRIAFGIVVLATWQFGVVSGRRIEAQAQASGGFPTIAPHALAHLIDLPARFLLFAGLLEGRVLAEVLDNRGLGFTASFARPCPIPDQALACVEAILAETAGTVTLAGSSLAVTMPPGLPKSTAMGRS